ncbi:MAG: AGE family epimerase/isomerase [Oscillospiraceae bacterium]|jgi:mannobiose 2-epimerase|nr:AGE family epimerase/isomerase [Oscillospiraceae bacterium]
MLSQGAALRHLQGCILPFWMKMADGRGGYYGEADFYGAPNKDAVKGCVLNSRILWTFSACARLTGDAAYKPYADRALAFLEGAFLDGEYGGLYWSARPDGSPSDTRKQTYAQAFGIYALAEYGRAFGHGGAIALARNLYDCLETHVRCEAHGGYIEAATRSWGKSEDMRLSSKEPNCPKSMNTHLHVLEAYTNLAAVTGGEDVRRSLAAALAVMTEKILTDGSRFSLFFDYDWTSLSREVSYGHDIEGSWLLCEAAHTLGDARLIGNTRETAALMAERVYREALAEGGRGGARGGEGERREWWVQAEAAVGLYNAYELTGDDKYAAAAAAVWDYIMERFADGERGEWHSELDGDGLPDKSMPKAGFWKCPYHNSRACIELASRLGV